MWRRTIEDKIRNTGRSWNEVKGIAGDYNTWKLFIDALCSTRSKRNWWWWPSDAVSYCRRMNIISKKIIYNSMVERNYEINMHFTCLLFVYMWLSKCNGIWLPKKLVHNYNLHHLTTQILIGMYCNCLNDIRLLFVLQ